MTDAPTYDAPAASTGDTCSDRDGRTWEFAGEPEFPDDTWRLIVDDAEPGTEVVQRTTQGLIDEFGPLTCL